MHSASICACTLPRRELPTWYCAGAPCIINSAHNKHSVMLAELSIILQRCGVASGLVSECMYM